MPYLVDGDNLLGAWPGRRRSDPERRGLVFELDRFGRAAGRRVVVVFDGPAPPGLLLGPDVHFAGSGRTADEVILERLRAVADRAGWIVVTSDRSLGDQCRWLGARVERSHAFRKRLAGGATGEKPEREEEVERWLEVFGADDGGDLSEG
jgi:predicted RNA-binding protein with PIN domain